MSSDVQVHVESHAPDTSWSFERELILLIPQLRAFSRSMCPQKQIAEDVALEALAKAWRSRASFGHERNLRAWLFTILRNELLSHYSRASGEGTWDDESAERIEAPEDEEQSTAELPDSVRALYRLPSAQREALVLVGAAGISYEEAAAICGTSIGMTKSRVARARIAVAEILKNGPSPSLRSPQSLN